MLTLIEFEKVSENESWLILGVISMGLLIGLKAKTLLCKHLHTLNLYFGFQLLQLWVFE